MVKDNTETTTELPGVDGPGVAPKRIPEVDKLAAQYVKERDKRCSQTPHEIAAKTKLVESIHAHADEIGRDRDGTIVYRNAELVITLKPGKETLKVKGLSEEGGEED